MAKGLGKGLSALFSETEEAYGNAQAGEGGVAELSLGDLYPNPDQPRKAFDEGAMIDLMRSVKEHGVINPIVVNRESDGRYMIIAGERRYRAAMMAGLETVPVIIKEYSEKEIQEISLIENLQREDLNPIEAATAMKQLMIDYKLTQDELAERIGKSRPAIANTLRLLNLCPEVMGLVSDGKLSAGHARTIVMLPAEDQIKFASEAVRSQTSVRELEKKVRAYTIAPEVLDAKKQKKRALASVELKQLIERMRFAFRTKVSLIGNDKKGRIYIDYYSRDDLERISEILDIIDKQ